MSDEVRRRVLLRSGRKQYGRVGQVSLFGPARSRRLGLRSLLARRRLALGRVLLACWNVVCRPSAACAIGKTHDLPHSSLSPLRLYLRDRLESWMPLLIDDTRV